MDKSGAYLIDRSPEYFQPLLNYLRQGVLVLNDGINPKGIVVFSNYADKSYKSSLGTFN